MQPTVSPRFTWPIRLLIGFLLFDMVVHSFLSLSPYRDWMEEKEIERFPKRLPTLQEFQEASAKDPPVERVWTSLDSTWDFFKPWPDKKARDRLDGWPDFSMYAVSWVASRLDLYESIVGVPQRWTMFSPNATRETAVARFQLVFADGTLQVVRITADPEDLTNYSHWFEEKVLDAELKVANRYDYDSRFGYCNYLSYQHARNPAGAALKKIYIYRVHYRYPGPDEDVVAALRAQNGPPNWDQDGPYWAYEVATKDLRKLAKDQRIPTRDQLRQMPMALHGTP